MRGTSRCQLRLFLGLEGVLWLLFVWGDLLRQPTVLLKYVSILLCALFALLCWLRGGDGIVAAALVLTLGADTFLLLLDQWYLVGVLIFCGVQGLYLLRILREKGGHALWTVRLALWISALCGMQRAGLLTVLNGTAAFYFVNFLVNTGQSLSVAKTRFRLFSLGLILFLCCDLCVGAFNLPGVPETIYSFAGVGMWLFYLPAQVLIALSGLPDPAV